MEIYATSEMINNLIMSNSSNVSEMARLYNLYGGEHNIKNKTVVSQYKPNNKLINRYFKYVVDYPASYFLGIAPTIQHNYSDNIQDAINTIIAENNLDDLLYEACKEADIKGCSYLLTYLNEKSEVKVIRVPSEEMVIERNARTNEIELAMRYYKIESVSEKRTYICVEVYTRDTIEYWVEDKNGGFVLDMSIENNPVAHPFGRVPVVKIISNEEEESIISVVETLVNDYDKVFSDDSDMHEMFKNLKLIAKNCSLIPMKDDGTIDEEKLVMMLKLDMIEIEDADKETKASLEYLKREINTEATEKHLDRLNTNIHKFANVPDLSDKEFGQNLSGISIKFKYAGLDVRVGEKERKLRIALNELLKILQFPISIMILPSTDKYQLKDFSVKFNRNIPQNEVEAVDNVVKKSTLGIYDKETLLAMLGEKDPMAILDKKKAEDAEATGSDYNNFKDSEDEEI